MDAKNTAFPDWNDITPERAERILPGLLEEAEAAVKRIEEGETGEEATYENTVWALEDATRELWLEWGFVHHMLGTMNTPQWRKVEEKFRGTVVSFSLRVSQSRALYERAKTALARETDLVRRHVLERSMLEAELAGVALEGKEKDAFNAIQNEMAAIKADFGNAIVDATAAFKYEKNGKTWTIDDASYVEAMRECADREVRETLCKARAKRAPENTARIDRLLELRRRAAAKLGFKSYADLSIASKCAPGTGAVMKLIDDLDKATAKAAGDEAAALAAMQDAADGPVMPWDVSFLADKLKKAKYSYSESELKKHLEFPKVLAGLFRLAKTLFNVEVREIAADAKPPVWHEDVMVFDIIEDSRVVANFYLDPYARPGLKRGGAWMDAFRNRCDRRGAKPLALAVLNLKAPEKGEVARMTMRETETIFHEFGHALQCMLTRVGEESAAGLNLVEWDAVEVASQFMENWCLDERTGIELPAALKEKVKAAKNFRAATACRCQIAYAKTDLLLHGEGKPADADEVKKACFDHFGVPMVDGDRFLCAFGHIFSGGYAAGYYSYKWSETMSADCYGAFEEAGLGDDGAVRETGARYRETILARGGATGAMDAFRAFRGRDPSIDALMRQSGLSN